MDGDSVFSAASNRRYKKYLIIVAYGMISVGKALIHENLHNSIEFQRPLIPLFLHRQPVEQHSDILYFGRQRDDLFVAPHAFPEPGEIL